MAKAQFHRHQRVWVDSVGAWATVERLIPVWTKGFDEPVKITYDVGLGREFAANELRAEQAVEIAGGDGQWRLLRARNKWQTPEDCARHPHPGTFPVVVTDPADWGGWRVPGSELSHFSRGEVVLFPLINLLIDGYKVRIFEVPILVDFVKKSRPWS